MPNSFLTENLTRGAGGGYGGLGGGGGADSSIYDALMANASSNLAAKKWRQSYEENKRQFDTEAGMKSKELDALLAERDRRYQLSKEAQDVTMMEKGYQKAPGILPGRNPNVYAASGGDSGWIKKPGGELNTPEDIQKLQSLLGIYQGLAPYTVQAMDGRPNPMYNAQSAKLYASLGRQIGGY